MTAAHGMDASHTDLRSTGAGLSETGTSYLEEVRALRAYLEGEGNPWGDGMESMVGAAYLAVTRHALDVYESLAERQVTTGDGATSMAVNYRSAEQQGVEEAERIMRAVQSRPEP